MHEAGSCLLQDSKTKESSRVHLIALGAVETQGFSPAKVAQDLAGLEGQWVADGMKEIQVMAGAGGT